MSIAFTVPGDPIGKGRPRIGKAGNFSRMFNPEKTVNYENLVAWCGKQAMGERKPLDTAVMLVLHIQTPIPLSWSQKRRRRAIDGELMPISKPDASNVVKGIEDALNGICWLDDKQICNLSITKRYSETPGVRVQVFPIGADSL